MNCFVAFLDILGFQEMLTSKDFGTTVDRTFSIIDDAITKGVESTDHGIFPKEAIRYSVMSDSIILSIPFDPTANWTEKTKSLRFLLHSVEWIQFNCALENIWIRGGLSYGLLNHARNVVGQGLVNAYQLHSLANVPRVLVDAQMIRTLFAPDFKSKNEYITNINQSYGNARYSGRFLFPWATSRTTVPEDYPFFVHYLNRLNSRTDLNPLGRVVENLRTSLYQASPERFRKYRWVVDYLRAFVPEEGIPSSPSATVFHNQLSAL